jgi:hypothetical protein
MNMLSAIFDVALGLILVFLVMSVVASSISEYITNLFQRRAWNLERFLESVLMGTGIKLVEDFYNKTMLATQAQNGRRPSYLKAEDFTQALISSLAAKYLPEDSPARQAMVVADPTLEEWAQIVHILWNDKLDITDKLTKLTWAEKLRRQLQKMRKLPPIHIGKPLPLAQVLSAMINQAKGDDQQVRKQIETWYDNSMARVSGWYKGQTQLILLVIGIVLAGVLNVDTIAISNSLLQNPAVRAVVDDAAKNMSNSTSSSPTTPTQVTAYLEKLNLPISWPDPNMPANAGTDWWLHKLLGIVITGLAISQGAPFWFDMLNKVTNLRSGGSAPPTAQASAAQAANTQAVVAQATVAQAQAVTAVAQSSTAQSQQSIAQSQASSVQQPAGTPTDQQSMALGGASGDATGIGTTSSGTTSTAPDVQPGLG